MFLNDGHFERHLAFLGKLQRDSLGLIVCYSVHISRATLNISVVVSYFKHTHVFFKWRPIWTPSWVFWKAAGRFFRTFSMLFCPYFRSYTKKFCLLWAISRVLGQNGSGQNGIGQNGRDKMVWTKRYNFILCVHFNSVDSI